MEMLDVIVPCWDLFIDSAQFKSRSHFLSTCGLGLLLEVSIGQLYRYLDSPTSRIRSALWDRIWSFCVVRNGNGTWCSTHMFLHRAGKGGGRGGGQLTAIRLLWVQLLCLGVASWDRGWFGFCWVGVPLLFTEAAILNTIQGLFASCMPQKSSFLWPYIHLPRKRLLEINCFTGGFKWNQMTDLVFSSFSWCI